MSDFLNYRREQEKAHFSNGAIDPFASLVTVELNITELCNRKCVFCPRIDPTLYPNRNLSMSSATAAKIAHDLAHSSYKGRISFSGFGEPLLNKAFPELIKVFRDALEENTIECNTNGDLLTIPLIRKLFEMGLSKIYVNLYDHISQREKFHRLLNEAGISPDRYYLRDHWGGEKESFGLQLNNRSGMVDLSQLTNVPDFPKKQVCYYPFYKLLIDWDGQVLFCANDWGRKITVGNAQSQSIKDIWLGPKLNAVRKRLMQADRSHSPCNTCSVAGNLHGEHSFSLLSNWLKEQSNE